MNATAFFFFFLTFGNHRSATVLWFTGEETEAQRWQGPQVPLQVRTEAGTRTRSWRPGPAWEAAHWVCQGLRPAPLGAAQEGPSAFSVSPPPPPCLTPVWITFSPVPSQALPEVWLPPLLVPGNPRPWQCGSPGLAGPTQTVVKQWLSGQRKACLPRAGPRQRLQLPPHTNGPSY